MAALTRRELLIRSGGVAAAGLSGNLLIGCGGESGGGADILRVGMPIPLSGAFADFGTVMQQAATVAVERINGEGGILGRELEVKVEDVKSDPGTGARRTRRLVSEKMDVVIGTVSSAVTLAVLPIIDRADTTFIYPVDGDDRACTPDGKTNPRVFGLGDTPLQRQGKFVPYLVKSKGKRWYLLGNDYVFPRSELAITKSLLTQAGGTVVDEQYTPLGTQDYSPIVAKIRGSSADLVFAVVPGTDGVAFIKEAKESGLFGQLSVTGIATFAPEIYSGMAPYAEGVITCDRYSEQIQNPTNKEFLTAFKRKYHPKYPLGGAAACTYGAFLILREAAKKANSLDNEPLRKAMAGLKLELPVGDVEINPETHIMTQHEYVLRIHRHQFDILEDLGAVAQSDHVGCTVTE